MNTISYHIYNTSDGGQWFKEDEQAWTSRFYEATSFQSYELAARIAARLAQEGATKGSSHMVLAWVGG